jgi:hypothetical protein
LAAAFTFVVIVVGFILFFGLKAYIRHGRNGRWLVNPHLPIVVITGVIAVYLLAKVTYEEIYPCVAVDSKYCDFSSTQYRNLFGWEF